MRLLRIAPILFVAVVLVGCTSNPTNEPSAQDIQSANQKRAAAIDADPSMTPEQKTKMKEMLHLNGSGPRPKDK